MRSRVLLNLVVMLVLGHTSIAAPVETVIFEFSDLDHPVAGLLLDATGNLFGTLLGEDGTRGSVFKLATPSSSGPWTETTLTNFYHNLGGSPQDNLIADAAGALYGTGEYGGAHGWGTVFKLVPPQPGSTVWGQSVLHAFKNGADGAYPIGCLVADASGNLYGTTSQGGIDNAGVVFKLTPPAADDSAWKETILHEFQPPDDGVGSVAGLVIGPDGSLYGTTAYGTSTQSGTVFRLSPPTPGKHHWKETVLHVFSGGEDGSTPEAGLLMDSSGALFGTTYYGGTGNGGTTFKLVPPSSGHTEWRETILKVFGSDPSRPDGVNPHSTLIEDAAGNLYGTTSGGSAYVGGTVFKLVPPAAGYVKWKETVLYTFQGTGDGGTPESGVVMDASGVLYGTTSAGGYNNVGTAYKLIP